MAECLFYGKISNDFAAHCRSLDAIPDSLPSFSRTTFLYVLKKSLESHTRPNIYILVLLWICVRSTSKVRPVLQIRFTCTVFSKLRAKQLVCNQFPIESRSLWIFLFVNSSKSSVVCKIYRLPSNLSCKLGTAMDPESGPVEPYTPPLFD